MKMQYLKLNDGKSIPALGLGTWQGPPGKCYEVKEAILNAIDIGYRHFDCAHVYRNEKLIGEALNEKIKEGVVKREDLFITSKLWNTFHNPNLVETALRTTLNNLNLDYLNLYLIHWPQGFQEGDDLYPLNNDGTEYLFSNIDYLDTWKAMIEMQKKGLVKSIGVSNFTSEQIQRLIDNTSVTPAVNQIECHPYLNQRKLATYCRDRGVNVVAYSPLGSPSRPWAKPGDPDVLNSNKLKEIAKTYDKSIAQILLRYQIEIGNATIPKSSNKERLRSNIEIFDFNLAPETIHLLNSFDCNGRICPQELSKNHPYYPFKPNIEF